MIPNTKSRPLLRYGMPIFFVAFATAIRQPFNTLLGLNLPFMLYFPAVIASAWFGGEKSGLLATGISTILASYFLRATVNPHTLFNSRSIAQILLFVFVSSFINFLAGLLHKARQSAELGEEKFQLQAEQFRTTLSSIGDAGIATDTVGRITFINAVAESLTGWKKEEAQNAHLDEIFKIVSEQTREKVESPLTKVLRGETASPSYPTVLISRDGSEKPIDDTIAPILKTTGEIVGTVLVFRDITNRRYLEQRRNEAEARFKTMADTVPVLVWMSGPDKLCDFFNQNWLNFTGRTIEQELGNGWIESIHPDDTARCLEIYNQSFDARQEFEIEYRLRRFDGEYCWLLGHAVPRYDTNGGFLGYISSCIDITDRKKAAEAQALLVSIVESSADAIISKSLNGTIMSWNKGAERVFGYNAKEVIGQPITIIIPPEKHAEEQTILERIYRGERIEHYETIRVAKNGRRIDISLTVSPLRDSSGRVVGASKIARDISDRKQAEIERVQLLNREQIARSQAEEASRLKDEFLATISHELRTPLNAILGWSRMLGNGKLDAQASEQAVEIIVRNANIQSQLIEDLLDVSRIITGKLRLEESTVELADVIRAALDSARPTAEARKISIESQLSPISGPVRGDANRLQQVVWNLLTNAIKFTPKGGSIRVTLTHRNSQAEIIVSDTGQGIKSEFLPHVFDRFRQADATSTRAHGGMGLGLAIVRHLVELHGGSVEVESSGEGQGATFTVKLPHMALRKGERFENKNLTNGDNHKSQLPDSPPSLEGIRVLVIDDEDDTRSLMTTVLERCHAEVRVAASVRDALLIVNEWKPSIIVSDIGMPEEDGYVLIKEIRAQKNSEISKIPAVALTAYARSQDRLRALSSGYQMHVAKPVEPIELVVVIASLVHQERR